MNLSQKTYDLEHVPTTVETSCGNRYYHRICLFVVQRHRVQLIACWPVGAWGLLCESNPCMAFDDLPHFIPPGCPRIDFSCHPLTPRVRKHTVKRHVLHSSSFSSPWCCTISTKIAPIYQTLSSRWAYANALWLFLALLHHFLPLLEAVAGKADGS